MRYATLFGALMTFGCSSGPIQSYTVEFPALTVAPGVEKTQCVTVNLHNATEIHIGNGEWQPLDGARVFGNDARAGRV